MSDELSPNASLEPMLVECERMLEYTFRDRELLRKSLTHTSVSVVRLESNERLEFLGDSILGMVVCEHLFQVHTEFSEGELTRIKSALVSRKTCARVAKKLNLQSFLYLGKGVSNYQKIPQSIIAGSYEAVIAAIYLDGGLEPARKFIVHSLEDEIRRLVEESIEENYKSVLQSLSQKDFQETPVYKLIDEKGPDHAKCFQVAAVIGETVYPAAWGNTKKKAEQEAAQLALQTLLGERLSNDEA